MEKAETMTLWAAELERADRHKVDEHVEDELTDNAIMETFVPPEEPSVRPHEDYLTCLEGKKLMDDNLKTDVEAVYRRIVTGIVEEKIGSSFAAEYNV